MIKQIFKNITFTMVLTALLGSGSLVYAAENTANIENYAVSGWIPYWRSVDGARDALNHLDDLDAVHPFGYTVNPDGTLNDQAKIGKQADVINAWQGLFKASRAQDVAIVPTITWTNGAAIEQILGNKASRTKHIKEIVRVVKAEKFDGINIDYEQKLAETKDDFSLFLKELKKELGSKKTLACAIEARTPPESLYRVVPANLQYANDYKQIGKYCDQVQIMAYDQGRADWKLNGDKSGAPYIPVADKDWVRKVVELAVKDIPRNKIILGVPTYGHEYEVTVSPNWFRDYKKVRSLNHPQALFAASANSVIPSRNKAGEMSYSYLIPSTPGAAPFAAMLPQLTVPAGTPSGEIISQKALAYANLTGQTTTFNLVWWSDAGAIEDKLKLVREFNLKGLAIFRIDAEEDPALWDKI